MPAASRVELDLSGLPKLESLNQIEFDVLLRGDDGDEQELQPAVLHPDTPETLATHGSEYYARAGISGGVVLTVREPRPRLVSSALTRRGLELSGDRWAGPRSLALENRNGVRSEYPVDLEGERWRVVLPTEDADTVDGIRTSARGALEPADIRRHTGARGTDHQGDDVRTGLDGRTRRQDRGAGQT